MKHLPCFVTYLPNMYSQKYKDKNSKTNVCANFYNIILYDINYPAFCFSVRVLNSE